MEKINIEYENSSYKQKWGSIIIDLFCIFFVTFVFFSLNMMLNRTLPFYKSIISEQNTLKIESKLYLEDQSFIIDNLESNTDLTYEDKKETLRVILDDFYQNREFTSVEDLNDYNNRRLQVKENDVNLFYTSSSKIVENNLSPETYYNFYKDEINNHSIGLLYNNGRYVKTSQDIFIISLVSFIIDLFLSHVIFKLIIPLTLFKEGRRSLGMAVFKVSYVTVSGLNMKAKNYVFYWFMNFLVYYVVNFFSFLLVSIVSISMMYFSKSKQSFLEYVFNIYLVDSTSQDIYYDLEDYQDKIEKKKNAKLQNNDLLLK